MNRWRSWPALFAAAVLGLALAGLGAPTLTAQPRDKAPDEPAGKYRIHQARLSNREDYTLLLDTTTGRTWVLGLSRDGSRLSWFDLGLPTVDRPVERK